uniref:sphinganine-1-phosphate aldolase n=1 Tax=Panagrellus redivivus TaxID=6233 RepID=A0A7E5A038_PANRE
MPLDKETAIAHITYGWEELNNRVAEYPPWVLIGGTAVTIYTYIKLRKLLNRNDRPLHSRFLGYLISWARMLPAVEKQIQKELAGISTDIVHSIHKYDKERKFITSIPPKGLTDEEIMALANEYLSMGTFDVKGGRVSGAVYTDCSDKHIDLLAQIFKKYAFSNPLHPDVFPGVRKMEAEIIRMVAKLYHGDEHVCGTLSSGGTESIMLACLAYRNRAVARGVSDPVIVVPVTAHAAFDKAAHLMGIRIVHVAVDKNNRVDLKALKRAISSDTCVIVGSAPNFPSGTIDDIVSISNLGLKYKVPVHVDACLGGFLIPFMEEAGFPLPLFDFRLPGVTSISCDTHKYGYSPKGSSVVLYKSPEYLHDQYFTVTEWTGGIYATPTFAGSRSGLAIALTWATLVQFGHEQYVNRARAIIETAKKLANEVQNTPGLVLAGASDVSVVSFRSNEYNIYAVADKLHEAGWNLNSLQNPDAVHFCMTYNQANDETLSAFVTDLRAACAEVASQPNKGGSSKTAAIYGTASTIPDRSLVDDVTYVFLDACYATPAKDADATIEESH